MGDHLWPSLLFNKVTDWRHTILLKRTQTRMFFYEFCKISEKTYLEHLSKNS